MSRELVNFLSLWERAGVRVLAKSLFFLFAVPSALTLTLSQREREYSEQ
jgi:hypothetical protein